MPVDGGVFRFRKLAIASDSSDHECDAPSEVVRDLAENEMPLSLSPGSTAKTTGNLATS